MRADSYQLQNRLYVLLLVVVTIVVLALLSWGWSAASRALGLGQANPAVIPLQSLPTPTVDWSIPKPEPQTEPEVVETNLSPAPTVEPDDAPQQQLERLPDIQTKPIPDISPSKNIPASYYAPKIPQAPAFIQVNAFRTLDHARAHRRRWASRVPLRTYIGLIEHDMVPYKVLIGPFNGKAAAEVYRKRNRIKGFALEQTAILAIYME